MPDALVFVLDDDPLSATELASTLAQEPGFEVMTFSSPSHLLRTLDERDDDSLPDAVIACARLAGMDCVRLLGDLRARDGHLVGLLMSHASDVEETARVVRAVGPLCHVGKPWTASELLPKLRAGLEQRRLSRALAQATSTLAARDAALAESARRVAQARAELVTTHTELETATERLVQAEELAAVGRVVTGIAHELSRQLTLVGYAEAIKARVAHDPELVELADIIVSAQKRLSAMVDEIRDFAWSEGIADLEREPADVAAVVDEALALLRYDRDVRQRAIERRYLARPLCELHRAKFAQVVINLVANAVLATEPGGRIVIELDATEQSAVLSIADEGAGMPADVLARLGQPFFTTRGDRGSGLGVGICMRIVEEHGGRISYQSELGRGTTARVSVPLIAAGAAADGAGTERREDRG